MPYKVQRVGIKVDFCQLLYSLEGVLSVFYGCKNRMPFKKFNKELTVLPSRAFCKKYTLYGFKGVKLGLGIWVIFGICIRTQLKYSNLGQWAYVAT